MAYVDVLGQTQTSITVCIRDLSQPTSSYGQFRARRSGGSWNTVSSGGDLSDGHNTGKWRSPNIVISGLSCGTDYTLQGEAYTNAWYGVSSTTGSTSACPVPSPSVWGLSSSSVTSTSISISWSASNTSSFRAYIGSAYNTISSGSTRSHTFSNLTPNTTYNIYVVAYNSTGDSDTSSTISVTTLTNRPTNWSWSTSKTSGGNFNLTATEWNSFTTRINEFRVYKGLSTASFTTAFSGNNFTATMFNQAKNAIGGMNATGITDRSAGQDVLASHLNTLRDKLNEL